MNQFLDVTHRKQHTRLPFMAHGGRSGQQRMEQPPISEAQPTLVGIAMFAGVPSEVLERVHKHCTWRRYGPGDPIVDYLDSSDEVFFVTAGEVWVTIYSVAGKAVSFRNLGPGDIFGEYAAIDGEPRCASVEARNSCTIASISGASFRKLLLNEPHVAQALIKNLVRNVRSLTKRVYEFSTLAVNNRIQAELLRLASLAPQQGKSALLNPAPRHSEIASRISTHREAVSRELNRLSRIGIIERENGTLVIKNVDRLAAMLHEMTGE
jgi:CRP/FNR family transcriptional regulator, cyclic AMP receptor protein